jgi:manganese/iron transport system substrate-binding protein
MGITEGPYTGKPNPHAWMSPANAVIYVENIRKALVKMDPANEATYNRMPPPTPRKSRRSTNRSARSLPRSRRSSAGWSAARAPSPTSAPTTTSPLYLWPINADAQGTPQQVRAVIDAVRTNKHPGGLFREHGQRQAGPASRPGNRRVRYGGVLYVDSLTDADGPAPSYLKLLEANAETIVKGFAQP